MNQPLFTGACTAMVTPFLNGNVNYPMIEQLLLRQVNAGVRAVVLAGTTGESATLTDFEKIELIRRSKEYIQDRCTVIAGTGSNCTAHCIELSIAAQAAGADALLIVSPYYNKANEEGLFAHYAAIAHAVSIPIILYNVPSRTGVDIPVSAYKRLSTIENIVGVKEASADIVKISRIRSECPDDFSVWSGNDEQIVPAMASGAAGVISVLSNVYPVETVTLCECALSGDYNTAATLQRSLMPLIDLLFSDVNPIPVKEAMRCIGYDCGTLRLPLTSLSTEKAGKIHQYFH